MRSRLGRALAAQRAFVPPPLLGLLGRRHDVNDGRVSQPRTVDVGASLAFAVSTSHSGNRGQDLVECDAPFEPGQRRAEAEVDAEAEGEVLVDLAVDVEPIAVRVAAVVAVRGADEEQHRAALGHGLAVVARRRGAT